MKKFLLKSGAACLLGLLLILSAQTAQAWTSMQDSFGWLIYLEKLSENSKSVFYEGTLIRPADEAKGVTRAEWDIAGVYRKTSQKLCLTVRKFGTLTNPGLLTYDLDRVSETGFTGFWWQSYRGDVEYTRAGSEIVTITLTAGGDFPDYRDDSGAGEGP